MARLATILSIRPAPKLRLRRLEKYRPRILWGIRSFIQELQLAFARAETDAARKMKNGSAISRCFPVNRKGIKAIRTHKNRLTSEEKNVRSRRLGYRSIRASAGSWKVFPRNGIAAITPIKKLDAPRPREKSVRNAPPVKATMDHENKPSTTIYLRLSRNSPCGCVDLFNIDIISSQSSLYTTP
jgi:hypothetical protein